MNAAFCAGVLVPAVMLISSQAVARGTPSKIAYDDAEVVVAIETVDGNAGLSVWTRDDLAKYPLLRPD